MGCVFVTVDTVQTDPCGEGSQIQHPAEEMFSLSHVRAVETRVGMMMGVSVEVQIK